MIQAFVWKADTEDISLVRNLIKASFDPDSSLNDPICDIQDLSLNKPEIQDEATLLAFGIRCFNIVSSSTNQKVHQLTTPKKLKNTPANKKNRLEAFQFLKKIHENKIEIKDLTLTDKDLEKILIQQLKSLQDTLIKKGQEVWRGTTATGRTIAITLKPDTQINNCEIVMTFEEVFAAKYAVEALGVDSLTIVGK